MTQSKQNKGMLRVAAMVDAAMMQIPLTVVSGWNVRKGVVHFNTEHGVVGVRFTVSDRDTRYPIESTRFYLDRAPISKRRLIQLFNLN